MTKITFDTYYDTYLFECIGHTEYATAGQDILCSAVSILCYTLRLSCGKHTKKEKSTVTGKIFLQAMYGWILNCRTIVPQF